MTYERGRYYFQIHGCSRRFRNRRSPHRRLPATSRPAPRTFRELVHHEHLLGTFDRIRKLKGQAPGIDGLTYNDFSRAEIANVLREVSRRLVAGTYRSQPARLQRLRKPSGGFRTLQIPTVVDRVVASAVNDYLSPRIDPHFSDRSHGSRPGRSVQTLLLDLESAVIKNNLKVIGQDDIRNAFDTTPIDAVLESFASFVDDADLLNLVGVILRGHEGNERRVGIPQGNPLSPLALNVYLDRVLDRPSIADPTLSPVFRYVDNLIVVGERVAEVRSTLCRVSGFLDPPGYELKAEDGPPTILSRQGARTEILGFRISADSDRLRIALGSNAWMSLENNLDEAHRAVDPPRIARAVIRGWIESYGPGFENADVRQVAIRIRQIATQRGFREIGVSTEDLHSLAIEAAFKWATKRRMASTEHIISPLSSGSSPTGASSDLPGSDSERDALRAATLSVPF